MDAAALRRRFQVPGLTFEDDRGLTRVDVATAQAKASIYTQGAHLTAWDPVGFDPAILLSHKTPMGPGKAIRGGIPIVFPWFATDSKQDRVDGHPGPMHGFARIQEWSLERAQHTDFAMLLRFTQGPSALSRSMGYDHFALTLDFRIGRDLTLAMTVANTGGQPLFFEQAFHAYYEVADIHEVAVSGLEQTSFIDKTDGFKVKPPEGVPVRFTRTTDRVYNRTTATCTIDDHAGRRRIYVRKSGSNSTIVWNAFQETPELSTWDWQEYVAVETGNVGSDAVTLKPGESSIMQSHVTLEKTGS